jgi:hypothetical protein
LFFRGLSFSTTVADVDPIEKEEERMHARKTTTNIYLDCTYTINCRITDEWERIWKEMVMV